MKKKGKILLGAGMVTMIGIGLVVGIHLLSITMQPLVEDIQIEVEKARERWVRHVGDADPGSGNSGFMYIMCYPHDSTPESGFDVNLSNGTAYEFADCTGCEMTNETPWSTTFDFVMKVRVNNTDGYNSSSSQWEDGWVRANLTVDFDYQTDINDAGMAEIVIGTEGSTYRWYNYYVNNSGSGYTLSKGESFNITAATWDVFE